MEAMEQHVLQEYGDFVEDYEATLQAYGYVTDKLGPEMVHDELSARAKLVEKKQKLGEGELPRPWRILDLATGTGNTAMLFFNNPGQYSVVGVDLTPEMCEKARERPFESVLCHNVEADDLPVEDASFDAVQFLGVCEFLCAPAQTFARMRTKLREDGLLLLTAPQKISSVKEKKYKIKTWRQGELEGMVQAAGFRQLAMRPFLAYNLGDVAVQYECTLWQKTG